MSISAVEASGILNRASARAHDGDALVTGKIVFVHEGVDTAGMAPVGPHVRHEVDGASPDSTSIVGLETGPRP